VAYSDDPRGGLSRLVLDSLDLAIVVLSADLERELLRNAAAARLLPATLDELHPYIEGYVDSRRDVRRMPPPVRLGVGGRAFYLRVTRAEGPPPVEIVLLNEEVLRDADAFRLLNTRYGVSHREYQVVSALRQGKTNRQIAALLGLAEGTVSLYVHHLLARFGVPNRTRLVKVVDDLLFRKT
jgi:DNA-binding NarL/FixJ family response regulator